MTLDLSDPFEIQERWRETTTADRKWSYPA
jgi:hypothetical protein